MSLGWKREVACRSTNRKYLGPLKKSLVFRRIKIYRNLDGARVWLKEKEDSEEREKMFGRYLNWSFYDVDEFYGGDGARGRAVGVNMVRDSLMKSVVL